jgi:hypothetical protein
MNMTYTRLPDNLPDILRKYKLTVVETPGWKTRGRPSTKGEFKPVGILCHHTATGKNWTDSSVVKLLIEGRSDLPGPLSQFGLSRDGTVHIIASGRCNHAGTAKESGSILAGDGNALYIGIEAFNDGVKEPWAAIQYNAYVTLCAALTLEITKNSVNTIRGHKETSITGKPDPTFNMDTFRKNVSAQMLSFGSPKPQPKPEPPVITPIEPIPEPAMPVLELWKKYSGKPSGDMHLTDGSDWKALDCVISAAPPIDGSEHHMMYARVNFTWTQNTGMAKVECKFVRSDGDETAFDERHYEHGTKSVPFQQIHFEDGSKLAGKWYMKIHGGGANATLTTRYCKTHVIGFK